MTPSDSLAVLAAHADVIPFFSQQVHSPLLFRTATFYVNMIKKNTFLDNAFSLPDFVQGGLRSVARSMPTSGAVDLVAARLNLNMFEVPTGWKYFGNVMDSKVIATTVFVVLYK